MIKKLTRYLAIAITTSLFVLSQAAWAGSCCQDAAEKTKEGKACEKGVDHKCCKEAAKKVKDAKACEKCSKKEEKN